MVPAGRKISILKIIAVILVFTVSFFTGKFAADWGATEDPQQSGGSSSNQSGFELPVNRLNVLLLGIDARPGEKDARTDSMMLVSIDRDTKKIAVVSIPRDTMVEIDGHGTNKINTANLFGGADLARKTVENLLGVEIPYYVKTNFNGFKDIVDVLGGVDINVEKRMYYPAENINLKPGQQRLNGYDALGYVRFRYDALGDIGRTERQQKFLRTLAKEMLRPSTIIKAPMLVPKLMAAVDTNLGVGDAILVAKAVSSMDSNNIATATLPGVFYNYKGISYWKVDQTKAQQVLQDLFTGVRVATISGPDENVPSDKAVKRTKQNQAVDSNKQPAVGENTDNNGQATEGQNGGITGTDNTGEQQNPQGYPTGDTGQYPGQEQGGQYPGQDQGGQYPGQDQNGQYPGQNQGGQTSDQNQNGQVIINGQNNTGQSTGGINPLNKPSAPVTQPVQSPSAGTDKGQTGPGTGTQPSGTTSSTNVTEG